MTDPSSLLLSLAAHDQRVCFAYNSSTRQFIYLNPAFEKFFQVKAVGVTANDLMEMVHADDQAYLLEQLENLSPDLLQTNIEFRVIPADQKEYSVRLNILPQKLDNGEEVLTGYLEDISADKAQSDNLNKFNNKKNSILNILSHDLAGPLGSIRNMATLISRKTSSLEDQQLNRFIASIEKLSSKSIKMIQEFIQQEFIESAGVELLQRRANLAEKFMGITEEYVQSEAETGITFHFHSSHAEVYANVDESKFLQAVSNLISNALKFTPDGGTITLGLEEKEETILVSVADTGIGIPQKFHATLFDKFNSARRQGLKGEPSVGLGMSIIKTIVEWHDGRIWFESAENLGTTFYIELPKVK
jgi:two-component system sensor histidine kinase VicK